jgi:GTP-binding protein
MENNIRNVAIIAHVDHGKTTLVDALLRQSKTKMKKEVAAGELIMDSNDLEKERGITIFSKNASVDWQGTKINIIDTPGHADFGGEVERVLSMADGCLLLVDAKEGPMPQTRFVLRKAIDLNLKIIVVVNKIDKPDARPDFAIDKTFDLFVELGAPDELTDFPIVYASAKQGLAGIEPDLAKMTDISPIFEAIMKYVPGSTGDPAAPLQMLITTIGADNFKGRIATGRIYNGTIKAGQEVMHINRDGVMAKNRLVSLMTYVGLDRLEAAQATAGDIVAISGIPDITIGETIADPNAPAALPVLSIEQPTVKMTFCVNDAPFGGTDGQFTTSRQIRDRLNKELEHDMALKVEDIADPEIPSGVGWIVSGRGELHLAILIERMRREGYEFQVSRPQVIEHEENGVKKVPFERLYVEVPETYSGKVIERLGGRHGQMLNMYTENGMVFLEYLIPTRGLIGYRNDFMTDTKGLGIMNSVFEKYDVDTQAWKERENGSLVSTETGQTLLYGLMNVQDRGTLFYGPGETVYKGQVVGQNSREDDVFVNVCKEKQLSNMRSKGSGVTEHFDQPKKMDLEDCLEYIGDDELVEVTPKNVRMRKKILDESEARRKARGIKS